MMTNTGAHHQTSFKSILKILSFDCSPGFRQIRNHFRPRPKSVGFSDEDGRRSTKVRSESLTFTLIVP